nr:hypothetical protein KitaXyl93_10850 [Kitasatospora sp. Xyl93]
MTTSQKSLQQAGTTGLLQAVSRHLGHDVAPEWRRAAHATPRHRFLPARVWLGPDGDALAPCDRGSDPDRWWDAAYADEPVVTQINDGQHVKDPSDTLPSSSASALSIVFRILELLGLEPAMTILEIGTGTGFNAALLSHRLDDET